MPLMEEILRHDKEFCELVERLERDKELSDKFYGELEELKQIRLPVSED